MKMNFARMMEHLAVRYRDHEALVNIERRRRYTHRELQLVTNRIVNMMRERLQLRRGDTYLCILDNDNLSLLHAWTALKGEAGAVWTNYRDSIEEHRWQTDFIAPKVAFIENALIDSHFEMLRERGVTVVCMDPPAWPRDHLLCFADLIEGVSDANPDVESDIYRDNLVYRFTGGTTGRSKCAQYTMDNWLACRDSFYALGEQTLFEDTRYLHMTPISHGTGISMLPTLFRGGCTVTQNVPDLVQWCRNVETERITACSLVPTLLYRLLDLPEAAAHDLSTLSTCGYGAAPMSAAKLELLQARFGNIFAQSYGSTEAFQRVTTLSKADHLGSTADRLGSAGKITAGVELMIVDDEGRELSSGATGEIWIRGRATIAGYYKNPESTAAEFVNGFWKSGDLGYLDEDGYLFIVDRKKDMIISGGFNVYAIEVESALNAHPAVSNAAVIGRPDEEWGEAVHAEVILRPGIKVSSEVLIEHVKAQIGRFKAPKSIAFVDELPLSVAGKVLRRKVREKYWTDQLRRVG